MNTFKQLTKTLNTTKNIQKLSKNLKYTFSTVENESNQQVNFGFKKVNINEKQGYVDEVFHNVAKNYDLMNDAASLGIHRCWKSQFVNDLGQLKGQKVFNDQGQIENIEQPRVLDVAGGTGDIAFKILENHSGSQKFLGNQGVKVTVCDINQSMLDVGQQRAQEKGISRQNIEFINGNAEQLPFEDNTFDAYTISFGIRNVPRIELALSEAHRVLKQGGRLMILEFSKVDDSVLPLTPFYNFYNFNIVPLMGQIISNDRASYEYLAESIEKFHDQESLLNLIDNAGFKFTSYKNLTQGIVAIHSGFKL